MFVHVLLATFLSLAGVRKKEKKMIIFPISVNMSTNKIGSIAGVGGGGPPGGGPQKMFVHVLLPTFLSLASVRKKETKMIIFPYQ